MKGPTRFLTNLCLISLAVSGCSKKQNETADQQPGAEGAKTEAATNATGGNAPGTSPSASSAASKAAAELGATDASYEAWFKKYHLDLNDPKMLDADPDGDGFTNREEFLADTNPLDPESRPGWHGKMRLKEFTEVRIPFILRSVEGETAKIEHEEGGEEKTETVKAGQTIRGSQYKVEKVESLQTQDKDGRPVDASKVTIEDPATKQKIDLVKDMPARSTASFAVLTSTDGATSMTVKQGDTFSWPGETGATYRVVDLRADQVVLEQLENKKMWTVPKKK